MCDDEIVLTKRYFMCCFFPFITGLTHRTNEIDITALLCVNLIGSNTSKPCIIENHKICADILEALLQPLCPLRLVRRVRDLLISIEIRPAHR